MTDYQFLQYKYYKDISHTIQEFSINDGKLLILATATRAYLDTSNVLNGN